MRWGARAVVLAAALVVATGAWAQADRSAAGRQRAALSRQYRAAVAGLGDAPALPGSAADAARAAARLRALAGAEAAGLARLQEAARLADALSASWSGGRRTGSARATSASPEATLGTVIARLAKGSATSTGRRAGSGEDGRAAGPVAGAPVAGAPVAGEVVQRFGQPTDAGPAAGTRYAPPSGAAVRSPCRGRIDFAGPFRSYGQMVIVDCGRGYRYVLAGLDRIDASKGQRVGAGAALGRMAVFAPGAAGRPTLTVQLRHGSVAVDPAGGRGG